jgi:hypothetical protein
VALASEGYSWKEKEDSDAIVVHSYYKVAATDKNQVVRLIATVKRGANPQASLFPPTTKIHNEETIPLIVDRRDKGQSQNFPILLTFKAGQFAATLDSVWKNPPVPPHITTVTTQETVPCSGARLGAADDGLPPIYGDKHRFSLHCIAPGKVTSVDVVGYDDYGGCGWVTRFDHDPADAIGNPTPNDAWVRFWSNSSSNCVVRMSVHYIATRTTCEGDNCPGKIPFPSAVLKVNYQTILEEQLKLAAPPN